MTLGDVVLVVVGAALLGSWLLERLEDVPEVGEQRAVAIKQRLSP